MSRSRLWRIVLFSIAGIVVVLLVAGWAYLNSAAASRQVAGALSDALGSPIELDGASIGLAHTEVQNIRVRDPHAPDGAPWLKVERAEIALPLMSVVFGDRQPREVVLRKPSVTLRLDKDGNVLTGLPESTGAGGAIPPVKVQDGELTLIQDGEPERQFHGVNAALVPNGRALHLDGGINDPEWGQWSFGGDLDLVSHKGTGWLATQTRDVSMAYLKRIPFVPSSVWEAVQLEGKTPARVEFTYDPAARVPFSYRVDLDPVNTNVTVTSVDLRAMNASGHVTVENGVVTLRGVVGQTAGGTLILDSEMDFRDRDQSHLHFKVVAKGLQVQELSPSWGLPRDLSGRLTGEADLDVIVTEQGTKTSGTGRAVVTDVRFGDLVADPIVLTLHPAGRGFRFRQNPQDTAPVGKDAPAPKGEDRPPPPPPPPPAKEADAPKAKADRQQGVIGGLPGLALRWIGYLVQEGGANPDGRTYLTINLGLTDVDVAQALKQLRIQVPVTLAGRVTLRITADVPTDTPNDYKTYHLRGTLSSKRLEVEGVPIEDLSVRADVRNGILRLDEFSGRSPPASPNKGGAAGSFNGSGEMRLAEAYPFRTKINISGFDLASAGQTGASLPVPVQGVLSGSANLEGTLSPMTIRGSGRVKATNARIGAVPVGELDLNVTADGDRIKIDGAHAALLGGEVTANAVLPLRNEVAGKAVVELKDVDVGELVKQLPASVKVQLSGKAGGTVTATIPPKQGNEPRRVDATVNLTAPELRLQNFPVEDVKGSATYAGGRLKFKLTGALAGGGTLDASGEYPAPPPKGEEQPQPKEPPEPGLTGRVRIEGLRLSRLRRALNLPRSLAPLEGEAGLDLNYHVAGGRATGVGSLYVDRITWRGREVIPRIRAVARLTDNQFRVERLSFPLGGGEVTGLVRVDLESPGRSRLVLTARGVPAETLLALLPGQRGLATGRVDISVRTTLGRPIRGEATIMMATGTVAGAPARDLRVPLEWLVSPDGSGDLHFRDVSGTVAHGQVKGSAAVTLFGDLPPRLTGGLQFTNLNLQTLSTSAESVSGTNHVTGRFDFSSDRLQSANDLRGNLFATLGEAQPFQLPVLSNILPIIGGGRSNMSTTRRGEVRATLAGGVFRVQHFSLTGNSLDLFGDGTVTIAGDLNLAVTVSTHPLPIDPLVLRLLGIRIPVTVGPIPVGLIVTLTTYLSNRVIHLSVTGSFRNPTVRVQALQTLSENAVRYFLERSLFPVPAVTPAP